MGKPVLFVTGLGKQIDRAENMRILYEAYQGEKKFVHMSDKEYADDERASKYGLIVIDVFPTKHPAKTMMIWHAIQGAKYIGLNEKGTYYKKEYADYIDCIVAAGAGGIGMFQRCTGVPIKRIVSLGMPRTDQYFKIDKKHYMRPPYRRYLYAPTFRVMHKLPSQTIDWEWLNSQLHSDEIFYVKSHPYGLPMLEGKKYSRIKEVGKMESSTEYLFDVDVVITDYSSIMFDAYILRKPVVLYENTRGYTEDHGMYMEYPHQYCSYCARGEGQLLDMIRFRSERPMLTEREERIIEYVAGSCDGHSCERICKLINKMRRD